MGKKQYTELDQLFQSKLGKNKLSSGDWNEPTDDIFLAAMEKVNEQAEVPRKKKRPLWPLFLIPFVALLSISLWNSFEVGALKSTINDMQDQNISKSEQLGSIDAPGTTNATLVSSIVGNDVQAKNENTQTKNNQAVVNQSARTITAQASNTRTKSTLISRAASQQFTDIQNTTRQNNIIGKSKKSRGSLFVPPTQSNGSFQINNDGPLSSNMIPVLMASDKDQESKLSDVNNVAVDQLMAFANVPKLGGLLNIVERNAVELGVQPFAFANENTESKKKVLAFYAFLDLNLNSLRMSGLEDNSFSLTDYDKSYLGYNFGVGALQEINKRFAISYNLAYRHVKNHSLYVKEEMFHEDHKSTGVNGELLYLLEMEVQTPTGIFRFSEDVAMMDGALVDQAMMMNKTHINQTFNFLSLGVQPRLNVLASDKFNLFAEAGLNVNYLLNFCQNLDMQMYYGADMMMNPEKEHHNMTSLNRVSLAGSLGLGVEYQFGEHLFSSFKLGGSRSINSIRQTNNTNGVETFIDNIGVSLTAGYKF